MTTTPVSVAILVASVTHDTHEFISSLRDTLRKDSRPYETVIYYENNPEALQIALIKNQHAVLVTHLPSCFALAQTIRQRAASSIPLITAVAVKEAPPSENAWYLYAAASYDEYAEVVSLIMPLLSTTIKILLLYDSLDESSNKLCHAIATKLATQPTPYQATSIALAANLSRREITHLAQHDLVILIANQPTEAIQRLSLLCLQHKTALFVLQGHSSGLGAALGLGMNSIDIGTAAAELITTAVLPFKTLSYTPSRQVAWHLHINLHILEQQGLTPANLPMLQLLRRTHITLTDSHEKVAAYQRTELIPLE